MQGWDYSRDGAYFITICTQKREYLFGEISQDSMHLNAPGEMVLKTWEELPERFSDMELDARVLMPNHFHAIVIIRRGESCIRPATAPSQDFIRSGQDVLPDQGEHKVRPYNKIRPRGTAAASLSRIVQAFKSLTTHQYLQGVRQSGWQPFPGKLWQRNYYERVVRDYEEWQHIHDYIAANPINWSLDRENRDAGKTRPAEPWQV